jgi:hypothetical protein
MTAAFEPRLTWALLVPAAAQTLARSVDRAWIERFGEDEDDVARWETRPGSGLYSAVLCREPGTEGDDETLALQLSAQVPGELYALRFLEGAEIVWVFAAGAFVREEPASPFEVAARVGCPLVEERTAPAPGRSFCVVEGATADTVARVVAEAVPGAPVKVEPNALGAVVFAERGDTAMLAGDIAFALPEATVYTVLLGPTPGRFGVLVLEGERDVGSFEAAGPTLPDQNPLTSIKGATSPRDVLAALAVPEHLARL